MTTHTISLKDERATLSPKWLRKVNADPKAVILLAPPHLETLAYALEMADESAQAFIEGESHREMDGGDEWLDLSQAADDIAEPERARICASLEKAITYLEARGLLIHFPGKPLVRFAELPE